jgi:hypothetical protein
MCYISWDGATCRVTEHCYGQFKHVMGGLLVGMEAGRGGLADSRWRVPVYLVGALGLRAGFNRCPCSGFQTLTTIGKQFFP